MLRIMKATFMSAGGLLMTIACFLPWQTQQEALPCLKPPPIFGCLPPFSVTYSIWDIGNNSYSFRGISVPGSPGAFGPTSPTLAHLVFGASGLLILAGILVYFGVKDIAYGALHLLHVGFIIGSEAENTAPNSSIVAGSGVGLMAIGYIVAIIGYFIRPGDEEGAVPAKESANMTTPTTE
jgi:hypothetical protein